MPKIKVPQQDREIESEVGIGLMAGLLHGGIPVASSCGGDGVCGKCKLRIVEGSHNLTDPEELEKHLMTKFHLKPNERISCQARVKGDVTVEAGYW